MRNATKCKCALTTITVNRKDLYSVRSWGGINSWYSTCISTHVIKCMWSSFINTLHSAKWQVVWPEFMLLGLAMSVGKYVLDTLYVSPILCQLHYFSLAHWRSVYTVPWHGTLPYPIMSFSSPTFPHNVLQQRKASYHEPPTHFSQEYSLKWV